MAGQPNHTKLDIIALTSRAIQEDGYQSISLRQLLAKLHLTTGAFYKHFPSKEALFRQTAVSISQRLSKLAIRSIDESNPDPLSNLIDLGEFIIQQMRDNANLIDFLFFNPAIIPIYSHNAKAQESFDLLSLTKQLIHNLVLNDPPLETENAIFIKIWSFIQGYGLLVRNGAAVYDRHFLTTTARQLIGE